jgi:excisionase family DNA binding protein
LSTDTQQKDAVTTMLPRYLTTEEVAQALRTSAETVRYWRHTGKGPSSVKVGRRVLYRESDVLAWLEAVAAKDGGAA